MVSIMLTENEVVKYVSSYLKSNGYEIQKELKTTEQGIDIVAIHSGKGKCFVEAKGGTSSKKGTSRYGKPFSRNQIKTHMGAALLKALQIKQENKSSEVFIAVPYDKNHLCIFDTIKNCLLQVDIKLIFVKCNGDIEIGGSTVTDTKS